MIFRRRLDPMSFVGANLVRLALMGGLLAISFASARAQAPAAAGPVPAQPTELRADKLDMQSTDDETRAVCTGNVVLTGTNLRIACERLEIIATRIGDKDATIGTLERFKYLLATGRVRIVQGDREATCGRAEVLPQEEKVILTEDPVLMDHSTEFVAAGDKITLIRGQRQVFVDNPRLTGPTLKDLGPDAKKALEGTPAPKQP